jgi:hypothetical protein
MLHEHILIQLLTTVNHRNNETAIGPIYRYVIYSQGHNYDFGWLCLNVNRSSVCNSNANHARISIYK